MKIDVAEAVFQAYKLFLSSGQNDRNKAIELLGKSVQAHWAYVLRLHDGGQKIVVTNLWCSPDKRKELEGSLKEVNASDFAWSMEKLLRGESIVAADTDLIPSDAANETNMFKSRGIRSILTVPVHSLSGTIVGVMVFCTVDKRRDWPDTDVRAMELIAELLGTYWEREKAVAEMKESEERFRQLQKMEAVGRLAGGVAHELNNPLGIILGFAQSVSRGITDGDPLSMPLKSIEREALRCKDLVSDLLAFSHKSGEEFAPVDLAELIESTRTLVENQARLDSVEMAVDCRPDLPKIDGDANRLQQVLVNLATNAIDAMPDGGLLTLEASANGSGVVLRVSDTGQGMPPEVKEHIFEPFFTTKEVGKGTGLGLSLAYEIIHSHGGTIECDSTPGRGTTFTIRLPVR